MPADEFRLSPSQLVKASASLPLESMTSQQYDQVMQVLREVASDAYSEGRASAATEAYMRHQLPKQPERESR